MAKEGAREDGGGGAVRHLQQAWRGLSPEKQRKGQLSHIYVVFRATGLK